MCDTSISYDEIQEKQMKKWGLISDKKTNVGLILCIVLVIFKNISMKKFIKNKIRKLLLHWSMGRVFANILGDLGSIPGCVIPKSIKIVLDPSLLNTQQYKVCIKGKVEQSRERSSALPYTVA